MTTRTVPATLATTAKRPFRLALLQAATLLLATSAQAQSANCDKLRQTLSQRIEAGGVTGYGLDILPAKAPSPAGGKVIGTCDGGAFKAVYRRFGGPPVAAAEAASPAVVATPAPPPPAPMPAPAPVALKPPPKPEPEAPRPAPPPPPPPPAAKVPEPAPPPAPEPTPAPVVAAVAEPLSVVASAPAAVEPAASLPEPAARTSLLRHGLALFTGDWRWLWALLLLPPVGWLWAWANHRRHYDAAGLPRGPRL